MSPTDGTYRSLLVEAARHFELGNYELSKKLELEYLGVNPEYSGGWCNAGLCAMNLLEYHEASVYFKKALSIKNDLIEAVGNMVALATKLFDWESVDFYNTRLNALSINPFENPENITVEPNDDKLSESILYWSKKIEAFPKEAGFYINRGLVWAKIGMVENAKKDYLCSMELAENNSVGYLNLGYLLLNYTDDKLEAKKYFTTSYRLGSIDAYFQLFLMDEPSELVGTRLDVQNALRIGLKVEIFPF